MEFIAEMMRHRPAWWRMALAVAAFPGVYWLTGSLSIAFVATAIIVALLVLTDPTR